MADLRANSLQPLLESEILNSTKNLATDWVLWLIEKSWWAKTILRKSRLPAPLSSILEMELRVPWIVLTVTWGTNSREHKTTNFRLGAAWQLLNIVKQVLERTVISLSSLLCLPNSKLCSLINLLEKVCIYSVHSWPKFPVNELNRVWTRTQDSSVKKQYFNRQGTCWTWKE